VSVTEQNLWSPALDDPYLASMNYLNQIVLSYPDAISLAAGRPDNRFFDWPETKEAVDRFTEHLMAVESKTRAEIHALWGQYGKTTGLICEPIAEMLAKDEHIEVDPDAILVTVGAQEGMTLLVNGMCDPTRDVIIMTDPSYVGMVGAAKIRGVEVVTIPRGATGPDLEALETAITETEARGKRCKLYYEIPDFHNPTGTQMTLEERHALLALAEKRDFLIAEDNPYGLFAYEAEIMPTLKSLDTHRRVIYLGSFSKTLFPGLRLGYLVVDQKLDGFAGYPLAERLSRAKSMITVNTSALIQAFAGGMLLARDYSLRAHVAPRVAVYRRKRDVLLAALAEGVAAHPSLADKVSWTEPAGGFFMTVTAPMVIDDRAVIEAARDFGVIVCAMSLFRLDGVPEHRIRLSFSFVDEDALAEGARRLIRYLAHAVG